MRLTTEGVEAALGRVRFVPTLNAGFGELMGFHHHLLADQVRTGAFIESIRQTVQPLDFVVDLGTGTGVLAVAAAQAGAGTVIGIERGAIAERARALAAANDALVTVVQAASDDVRLPREVDVLVSECLGLAGLGGAMIGAVKRARDRWLKPGGVVIPQRVRVFAAPVEDPEADALVHRWDGARMAGVRLDVLGAHVGHNLYIAS
ncbi:MAG: 50S ribosomal protein L11 methyltransferase, partial [Rhodospirillales bacterium]|nr:50S ribosomal protein L11 methyltransferase [Rhodospirillales bacterium]